MTTDDTQYPDLLAAWDARRARTSTVVPLRASDGTSTRGGSAALISEALRVADTTKGGRNHALNLASFRMGQLVGAGELAENDVWQTMRDAATTCGLTAEDGAPSVDATIRSGIRGGMREPRALAPLPPPVDHVFPTVAVAQQVAAAHPGTDGAAVTGQPVSEATWATVDLAGHLDGTHEPEQATLLTGIGVDGLLYPGCTHSLHGESESGKSWVALVAAVQVLAAGGSVGFVDYESDPGRVVERLLNLGAARDAIAERFDYRRPQARPDTNPVELQAWADLAGRRHTLVVLDGVTEALAVHGASSRSEDEFTAWSRAIPRALADLGAAVVLVDHVTKDSDTRGRFAIGTQAKMATVTGAAYTVAVIDTLGQGLVGSVSIRVGKDRPGSVRGRSGKRLTDGTQEAAVLTLDGTTAGHVVASITGPRASGQAGGGAFRPTVLMERISRALESTGGGVSRSGLAVTTGGRKAYVLQALELLIVEGYVEDEQRGQSSWVSSVKPYREDADDALQAVDNPVDKHDQQA